MNNTIKRLSQIEDEAVKILADSASRKKELTAEYEEKTRLFDEELKKETQKRIASLTEQLSQTMQASLKEQEAAAKESILALERHFEENKERYLDCLFRTLTES
ncbi:MAG: hypothetical protein HFE84_02560 [Lachnospiraceae bacterium]|nr:hypothetical protein [Lachnospiraceae bacterium]